jgi:glucose/arabinose dehydrogenase
MNRIILFLSVIVMPLALAAQPANVKMTPVSDAKLTATPLTIAPKFKGKLEPVMMNVPEGYTVSVFHTGGLSKPRFMAWSADSVLHVANKNSGEIVAMPDRNHDGIADTAIVAASGFQKPHDVRFYQGSMYVADERRIWKLEDDDRDGIYDTRTVFINNIASGATQPGGGHDTRTLAFDGKNKKVYLSIGSLCNVCRETARAVIEQYDDDGTNRKVFATGIRNAVGMTIHPRTGRLWATNNGSDNQGNDIPPEWIDLVRENGFYGYPIAYAHGVYFDFQKASDYRALLPITNADSVRVRNMVQPAALVQAHSALMAIEFSNPSFPKKFQSGAFVAYRGSWNRNPATGYKVVYLDFDNDADTTANSVSDVLTGFVPSYQGARPSRWGRPVGLATDTRGNLYISSDEETHAILILSPKKK